MSEEISITEDRIDDAELPETEGEKKNKGQIMIAFLKQM